MNVTLEHPAVSLVTPQAWQDLLEKPNFSSFCGKINKIAKKIEADEQGQDFYHNPDVKPGGLGNKFKGDVFEVFVELLIKLSPIDERIGIHDYHPVIKGDTGVDGFGKARNGTSATVQVKYRSWDYVLTADREHLDNFRVTSFNTYKVDPQADGNMLIITAGKEIMWKTLDKEFMGRVRCIGRNSSYGCLRGSQRKTIDSLFSLQTLVDDNTCFWEIFRSLTC